MVAAYQDEFVTLRVGTALDVLRGMPEKSVHMAVTSPPYWGLRSYLPTDHPAKGQEIGTEKTPDEFVAKLVEVFVEVHRVLRDDGQLWVNIGDSYNSGASGGLGGSTLGGGETNQANSNRNGRGYVPGLKPKDLCMIPARLAIALQSWGWYLRQEICWAKDSCMPESVRDRCTRAHEFVYMLTKKPTYFYDAEAIKEPSAVNPNWNYGSEEHKRLQTQDEYMENGDFRTPKSGGKGWHSFAPSGPNAPARNARSVWRINPKPYPGSHFATFPPELPIRCIKAGTSERGVCSECGAPWRRVVEDTGERRRVHWAPGKQHKQKALSEGRVLGTNSVLGSGELRTMKAVGWEPTCTHSGATDTVPATVLDPFVGSGTTLYAARKLGRRSIGIDLDAKSADLLEDRLGNQGVLL